MKGGRIPPRPQASPAAPQPEVQTLMSDLLARVRHLERRLAEVDQGLSARCGALEDKLADVRESVRKLDSTSRHLLFRVDNMTDDLIHLGDRIGGVASDVADAGRRINYLEDNR